jgi:hypothetical protein
MSKLRVLVACEYSGTVRDAFNALGHEAMSCDLLPTDSRGHHYQGDVRNVLDGWMPVSFSADCTGEDKDECSVCGDYYDFCPCPSPTQDEMEFLDSDGVMFARPIGRPHWDLMIAHPPCTYLSVSGIHWNNRGRGWNNTDMALEFVRMLMAQYQIPRIALENPVSIISSKIRKPDQIIQPWQFGHDASKATCLWLKGLPPLQPTCIIEPRIVGGKKRWANQGDGGQSKLGPSDDRWKIRSVTYKGIAEAMADQWGGPAVDSDSADYCKPNWF